MWNGNEIFFIVYWYLDFKPRNVIYFYPPLFTMDGKILSRNSDLMSPCTDALNTLMKSQWNFNASVSILAIKDVLNMSPRMSNFRNSSLVGIIVFSRRESF